MTPVLWDARTACIGLRFGDAEAENGRWVAIADNVFVSVGARQTLTEVRLADVRSVAKPPALQAYQSPPPVLGVTRSMLKRSWSASSTSASSAAYFS